MKSNPSLRTVLAEFDRLVVHHEVFLRVYDELATHLQLGPKGRLIMVVGPTGVGKSTLLGYFAEELIRYVQRQELPVGPPLLVEAAAPEVGDFHWNDFYVRSLLALNEPGVGRKNNLEEVIEKVRAGEKLTLFRRLRTAELRHQLEVAIREHRPVAWLIDEGAHFSKVRNVVRRRDNLDVLKGHANVTAASIVIFGGYDMKDLLFQGGQLARRVQVVHFPRYQYTETDQCAFASLIATLKARAPLPLARDVVRRIDYYYQYSLGCAGMLCEWFRRAIALALKQESRHLAQEHLDTTRLTARQLATIGREIAEFETFFTTDDLAQTWRLLKLPSPEDDAKPGRGGATRPGERKPGRDRVGRGEGSR